MIPAPDLELISGFVPDHQALFDLLLAEVSWDERLGARKTASFGFAWLHAIPKAAQAGPRISLTFRLVVGHVSSER